MIAVIGILSGLIVVSMSGTTQKATIAKAQIFSNSLRNSLMSNLVSEWRFDNNVNDSWGMNNGTITGATYDNSNNDCVYGSCLLFTGTLTEYAQMPAISTITTGTPFIISVWVYPQIGASYQTILGYNSNHRLLIQNNGTLLSQQGPNFYSETGAIAYNQWSHILYWNDGTQEKWYVNGKQSGSANPMVAAEWDLAFNVGQYDLVNYPYKGRIDELRIYNATIPLSQIKKDYYSGLNSLLLSRQINKYDYMQRLVGLR